MTPGSTRPPVLPWPAAIRIAWREMRAARAKFLFVILAVAIGVGSLTGVRGFSHTFRHMLLSQARTLMAGDLTARIFALPTPEQDTVLRSLDERGVSRTWITETVTMASSTATPDPVLVSVKAVDPSAYPFYGEVKLAPAQPLREALTAETVVVSDDLLLRLDVRAGDTLRIGGQDFRIAGVMVSEPDRMTGSLNVGPRVMITRQGLDRTGLMSLGSRAAERYLFKLPAAGGPGVAEVRQLLKQSFPEATLADYTETHPIITRGLDRATTFLSLIGLIALVIGAMGVASAMHGHLQQKLDSIAMMKCIGARSGQIIRIYTAQTLMLGLTGGVMGAGLGVGVAAAFPGMIAKYFTIDATSSWDVWPAVQGVAIACLITLLFTLPPLIGIRGIRPAQIFRREMEETRGQPRRFPVSFLIRGLILLGTGAVAATLTEGSWRDSLRTGAVFAVALAIGLALLALAAWLFLRILRVLPAGHGALRHGIANLYRPGNQAQSAVVALGVGVMFTLTVFLVQSALVRQIRGSAPPGMPNVFLLDIPGAQRQAVSDLIQSQPGVTAAPEVAEAVAARITAIDGVPVENLPLRDFGRRFLRTRSVTEMETKPPETVILSGAWWTPGDRQPAGLPQRRGRPHPQHQGGRHDRLGHLEASRADARGVHPAHRIHPHDGAFRVHLQSRPACRPARHLLWQRARAARRRAGAAARDVPAIPHRDRGECGRRDADYRRCGGADCLGDPLHFGVHDSGRGCDGGLERGRLAVPPHARSGDSENAGSDAPPHRVDLLGGVSGAGRSGRPDGQPAGIGLLGAGVEAAAGYPVPCGRGGRDPDHPAFGDCGRRGGLGGQFPHSGPETP